MIAAGFGVWAAVLVIAFLSYRGSDVGQLGTLVGNLGGGPLFGGDFLHQLLNGFYGLGLGSVWFCTGLLIGLLILLLFGRGTDFGTPSRLTGVLAFATGSAIWSLVWFFLGSAGLYSGWTAIIVVVLGLGLFICIAIIVRKTSADGEQEDPDENKLLSIFSAKEKKSSKEEVPRSVFEKLFFVLIGAQIILSFIASLAPPIAKDTLLYHFALPKAFVAQGSNAFIEGNIASYLPLGTEMHVVWARLLAAGGADAASGAVIWLFFPLLLIAIYGWAVDLGISRVWALIGTLIVACIPTVYHVASNGYTDISLTLYVTLAVYALTRWWRERSWGWVILIAIFLGAALSVKLTAIFVIAAFALIILMKARGAEDTGRIVASGFAALLLAGVIASPWYLRTWVATGSPVFPFYMSMWKGSAPGWDVERSNLFQAMNSQYGGANKGVLDYLLAPLKLSVMAQPEQPAYFDGVLGVAFLIGLPLLIWALWKFELPVEIKIGAGVAGIMFLFWLFSSEQLRYLLPIVPVLAIAIAASAEAISQKLGNGFRRAAQLSLSAAAVAGLLVSFAWFLQLAPLRVVLGGETRDQYLARNLDYYPYYQEINTNSPADAKVWLINMRRDTYNLDRPAVSDYLFEDWTLRNMLWEARSSQELKAKAASLGVQYILTRHDFLFDYDRSTLVDDKKPRAENEAKLKMARDLVLDPARTVKADDRFSLVKLY